MRKPKGSITRKENGKYMLRCTMPDGKRKSVGVFETRKEAEEAAVAFEHVLTKEVSISRGMSLLDYGEKWLTMREVSKEIRDSRTEWSRWNTHIKSHKIAQIAFKKVTRRDVSEWIKGVERRVSTQTAKRVFQLMRSLYKYAVQNLELKASDNPCDGLGVKSKARTEQTWSYRAAAMRSF